MMRLKPLFTATAATLGLGLALGTAAFAETSADKAVPELMAELSKYQSAEATTQKNLETFDTLDFDVYTHQKWDRLHESHAENILVHYPDGSTTTGLEAHVDALKPMFVFAPDTRIEQHPVKFGSGEWTGVIGVLEGTFTKPMPVGDGKTVAPTGKAFKLTMATLGHWTKDGVMDEEYLFWDNLDFMKQIGLAQ
ncbi:ester cyclase [Rhodobacter lacus]|uniref:Ester cyclase n=1 Tax=Rhodobacter lacus TaxID=1641972 RepID=A0ABW5A654_9RHOB